MTKPFRKSAVIVFILSSSAFANWEYENENLRESAYSDPKSPTVNEEYFFDIVEKRYSNHTRTNWDKISDIIFEVELLECISSHCEEKIYNQTGLRFEPGKALSNAMMNETAIAALIPVVKYMENKFWHVIEDMCEWEDEDEEVANLIQNAPEPFDFSTTSDGLEKIKFAHQYYHLLGQLAALSHNTIENMQLNLDQDIRSVFPTEKKTVLFLEKFSRILSSIESKFGDVPAIKVQLKILRSAAGLEES